MASIEVLQAHYDSSSSNDFSILSYHEQPIQNGDLCNHFHENLNLTNMFSASAPDTSIVIRSQLNELLSENIRLKDKLSNSNSLMEEQLVRVQSWRDNILTAKNELAKTLSEAKERIALLEKENADLLEKVTNARNPTEERYAKTCRKCTEFHNDLTRMLGMDYCDKNQHLIMGWHYFNESLSENLKMICKHLEASKSNRSFTTEEKFSLECYISMLQFKIAFLNGIDMPPSQVDFSLKTDEETGYEVVCKKTSEAGKTIQELTAKVQEKDNQLASAVLEKEQLTEVIKSFENRIKDMQMASKRQYEDMTNKLKIEADLTQRYRERCDNFEQQIEEYEKKLDQTRARMSDSNGSKQDDITKERQELQAIFKQEQTFNQNARCGNFEQQICEKKLDQTGARMSDFNGSKQDCRAKERQELQEVSEEQIFNQNAREKLHEVMAKCEKLQADYELATMLLKIQLKEEQEKNEKLESSEHDIKQIIEEADHQTAKLFATREQLIHVTREMKRLQRELEDMKDKKKIEPLKDQISSYRKGNPEMERAAFEELERLQSQFKECRSSSW